MMVWMICSLAAVPPSSRAHRWSKEVKVSRTFSAIRGREGTPPSGAGSAPERTLVFEDALHAARTAKEAGFLVAGVYDPSAEGDQEALREVCDWYLPRLDDLDFLAKLG